MCRGPEEPAESLDPGLQAIGKSQMSSLGAESLEGTAGAKARGWKARGMWLVTPREEGSLCWRKEGGELGSWRRKLRGQERAPEQVLHFPGCPRQPQVLALSPREQFSSF